MKQKTKKIIRHFTGLIFPAVGFGAVSGVLTGAVITFYKWCAKHVVALSVQGYNAILQNLWLLPVALVGLFGLAFLFGIIYKRAPELRGGGIPTAIAALRDLITFKWFRNLIGVFLMSMATFLVGVPLGSEGPSVQIGTAVGLGVRRATGKKSSAWNRYSMTGGACAGFAVATGAPVSGVMFALEEAHQRISPMIILVSATSVVFSCIVAEVLSPVMGVSFALFPALDVASLAAWELWIPVLVGVVVGLGSVLLLKYYEALKRFVRSIGRVPAWVKIFLVLALTLCVGLLLPSGVSTGHELMLELLSRHAPAIWILLVLLVVRTTLTLSANVNGVTGGMFLPLLALGALLASVVAQVLGLLGLGAEYYSVVLVLGITAAVSGMIKAPVTAVVFAIEAMGCIDNVLAVIIVSVCSFLITEMFGAHSVTDSVLEDQVEVLNKEKERKVIDAFVTVKEGTFAVGKQIRDILWPVNLFVLSVQRAKTSEVDEHGGKTMMAGDVLHVRYSTTDEVRTRDDLTAIVGEQDYAEREADVI